MKIKKQIILSLLTMAMLVFGIGISAKAVETDQVTRAQWLSKLVEVFEMTVEDEVYPDNYFSDLDSESEYYYDILLAVEFGVIDVPAGGEVRPDDPVTREEAVTTLNFCLGYELEEGSEYTFSDEADLDEDTNPDDVQIAVNRDWIKLIGGKFLPKTNLTGDEMQVMMDDAAAVLEAEVVDENYDSVFELADDVVVVSYSAVEVAIDETSVTITDLATDLEVGDKFAVYENGVPFVAEAAEIKTSGNQTVVKINEVADEEAYKNIDAQGVAEVDFTEVEIPEGSEIVFIDNETGEEFEDAAAMYAAANARATVKLEATMKVKRKLSIGNGLSANIEATLTNPKVHYGINWDKGETYAYLTGDLDIAYTVKGDLAELAGLDEVLIFMVGVPGVGGFDVYANLEAAGSISTVTTYYMKSGVGFTFSDGFRQIKSFKNKAFSVVAEATAGVGATMKLGVTQLPVLKAYIYADAGARIGVKHFTHEAGTTPAECVHFAAYVYADYGATASVDFGILGESEKTLECVVYDENNSPFRIVHHYEDGAEVAACTMGHGDPYGYFTCNDSIFCGSGYGRARSQGLTRSGEPVIIYTYTVDADDNAIITKFTGNPSSLTIPSTLDGHTVIRIEDSAFSGNKCIKSVIIPDTVTFIGDYAFANCTNLSNVKLSKNLVEMESRAFMNCTKIKSIEIPKSLTTCDDGGYNNLDYTGYEGPFYGCSGLKYVTFEEGTTLIAHRLFGGCSGLEEITIPDTVLEIGEKSFGNCDNLKKIVIPESVTQIDFCAFKGCDNLKEVQMGNSVVKIRSYAFAECPALSKVNLPTMLEEMGARVFANDVSITEITIPKSLTVCDAGNYANLCYCGYEGPFYGCSGLKTVNFEKDTTAIAHRLFAGCSGLEEITIPDTVTSIGEKAFGECDNLKEIIIPDSVTEIQFAAFLGCDNLKKVEMGSAVKVVSGCVFENCESLSDVTLSNRLQELGSDAFKNCVLITEIAIPKSLTVCYGGNYSNLDYCGFEGPFNDCSGLKKVTFEEGTSTIAHRLFAGCTGLEEITIPDTVTSIGEKAFAQCTSLKGIEIPDSVVTIGMSAFYECTGLKTVKLPNNIKIIDISVFLGCTSLKEITIPESVTRVRSQAFKLCGLEKVTFENSPAAINEHAFRECASLVKVDLGEKVTSIGERTFHDCDSLTDIALPDSMTSIGAYAFYDSDALKEITIPNSVTSIGNNCFEACDTLETVTFGTGITAIPNYMFNQCVKLNNVKLPYRTASVGDSAFTNCTALTAITIPRATTSIAANAFSYPDNMTIYGVSGTYAETYATENSIKFVSQEVNATEVTLDQTELQLNKGKTAKLVMTITPADCTDEVSWKSSDENVVTITETGLVTAKNVGTATIKVVVGSVSTSCKVTVVQPVTGISMNQTKLTMEALDSYQLKATVRPAEAYNQEVVWSSSDETIAAVDETGLVTAVSKGTATITVEAQDGSGVKGTCTVTVTNNGYVTEDVEELESPHNYDVNCTDFWEYTRNGAEALAVTFDEQTNIEDGFDYLYIYDGEGNEIGKYTGKELAGATITVPGSTVKIQFASDESGTAWGFKVTGIEATTLGCEHEYGEWEAYDDEKHVKVCECGDEIYEDHSYGEWITITEPTYESVGEEYRVCEVCEYEEYREIPKLEDDPVLENPFTDVKESDYFYQPVLWAVEEGITQGTSKTKFGPDENCTRAQVVTFLWRASGSPMPTSTDNPFRDVGENAYYYKAVLWAVEEGITQGTSKTKFGPDETCTRAQVVTFLHRANGKPEPTLTYNSFSDVDENAYYNSAVLWAVEKGITQGTSKTKFGPDENCTRAQVVTFLYRAQ